jgi:hypothetical protein
VPSSTGLKPLSYTKQERDSKRSEEFFVGVELAVFGRVVEGDVAVSSLFELIDFARVEGL